VGTPKVPAVRAATTIPAVASGAFRRQSSATATTTVAVTPVATAGAAGCSPVISGRPGQTASWATARTNGTRSPGMRVMTPRP
jgi:hypothetical protein